MKNLQFNPYQCGVGMGRGGAGLKSLTHPCPAHGVGLKSHPIPAPLPLWGGENPHRAKQGGVGQARRGKIDIPTQN